ncbi:hypothetical protein BH10PSE13_BH10PSE13_10380 [soil metagenome]
MITQKLAGFAAWLGGTPLTALVAGHFWIVPTLQTIHILAVAVVLVSVLLINLRVLGLMEGAQPVGGVLDRYLRPTGIGVLVLAVTGFLLIAGEPTRAIFRILFWVKMLLIVIAFTLTWSHRPAFAVAGPGESASGARKAIAIAALLAWLAVIVAGRWVAYVEAWPGAPE